MDELLNYVREIHTMVSQIHHQVVAPYPGADSFGQNIEGEEITLRAGIVKKLGSCND